MAYENLQALMARAHMLKKDLAALLGRDNAVVTNLLKGGRPLSSEETKMLAQHFGVSTDTILDAAPLPAANALRALREDRGLAPETLARACGIDTARLHKLEIGGPLSTADKERLAPALECHPGDLDILRPPAPTLRSDRFRETNTPSPLPPHATSLPWQEGRFLLLLGARHTRIPASLHGKLCWIECTDGTVHLRRLLPARIFGQYDLQDPFASEPTLQHRELRAATLVLAILPQ